MISSKRYIAILVSLLFVLFASTLMYAYFYSKNYPIPLSNRISLDAKIMFLRDMSNRDDIDTIILGSSIGLNNVNGVALEETSSTISHVLNLAAFSLDISYTKQFLELFSLFPNLKRIIYSAQTLDFGKSKYEPLNIELIKTYIKLDRKKTNWNFISLVFNDFTNVIKRRLIWEEKYLVHNSFYNLDFDRTGSALLDIYGKDIIMSRWNKTYVNPIHKQSYKVLDKMIKELKEKNIDFYLFLQPYRKTLVNKDKKLRKSLDSFHKKATKVVLSNKAHVANLHKTLNLGDEYFADRIHLNSKGSTLVAEEIAHYVDSIELAQVKSIK